MLSYAGIALTVPTPEVAGWISRAISTDDIFDFQERAWPGKGLTAITFPGSVRTRPVKLQSLWWPTGASRWATGYFLASEIELALIRQQVYQGSQYTSQPLTIANVSPGGTQVGSDLVNLSVNLWMLPPRPLSQIPNCNGLYLLTLVDDRYWWWFQNAALTVTEGTTTWAQLYSALGSALEITIAADPINAAYLKPSAALALSAESLPLILDAVAYNCGQRITRDCYGTVRAVNMTTSQATVDGAVPLYGVVPGANVLQVPKSAGGLLALGTGTSTVPASAYGTVPPGTDLPAVLPASVTIRFPKVTNASMPPTASWTQTVTLASLALPDFSGVQTFSGTKVFHDTTGADFTGGGGSPANATELTALCNQVASDFYRYAAAKLDLKVAGIVAWPVEGLSDSVEWTYAPWDVSTRVQRPAWNDRTEELLHRGSVAVPAAGASTLVVQDTEVGIGLPVVVSGVTTITFTSPGLNVVNSGGGVATVNLGLVVDNTPAAFAVNPCNKIAFQQTTGLDIDAGATGEAKPKLLAASQTQAGGIALTNESTTQTLGTGPKAFRSSVFVNTEQGFGPVLQVEAYSGSTFSNLLLVSSTTNSISILDGSILTNGVSVGGPVHATMFGAFDGTSTGHILADLYIGVASGGYFSVGASNGIAATAAEGTFVGGILVGSGSGILNGGTW
jgi:hypothetical protein